jgi:hypothetical protein
MFNTSNHQENENQTILRHHLTPVKMSTTKKLKDDNAGKDVEKRQPIGENGN